MKVKITWTELVTYKSEVELDDALVESVPPLADWKTTKDRVTDLLENVEELWFDQCDTERDFLGASERTIEDVELIEPTKEVIPT